MNIKILIIIINCYIIISISSALFAQTPENEDNLRSASPLSNEFNGSMNSNWQIIPEDLLASWGVGDQKMLSSQIDYETSGSRHYIEFNAEADNGINYSAGIKGGGFGYGYYEIEARVIRNQGSNSGLWPAFWTLKGSCADGFYEEIDIFEPGVCQENNNEHFKYRFWL